ncbi:EamA family transporter [Ornithinimicrobium cryptoxanthini]|uniref:EamA family transporter n=1 Tax=Ornithinimicrobium cryptoxanthini TaxID=2934161 RepID=UPI00351C25E0
MARPRVVTEQPSRSNGFTATLQGHPVLLVLAAVLSVQFGGALAATLLPLIGVFGSVLLRILLAAVMLVALVRPRWRGRSREDWLTVTMFALALTCMNVAFYASLERLPIGVAVTIEFLGPLTLAAAMSRRRRDISAVALAVVGVVLISEVLTVPWAQMDLVGIGLAAAAGGFWACYILLSGRTGARFEGLDGMAIALVIGGVAMLPLGLFDAGTSLLDGEVLLRGLGIALLSSAIPYSLELLALRRLSAGVFGILLSLEPAAAALAGLLVLGQTLAPSQLVGMALVVCASIAVLGRRGRV